MNKLGALIVAFAMYSTSGLLVGCILPSSPYVAKIPKQHIPSSHQAKYLPKMIVVPRGDFMMGSPMEETGRYPDEGPQHKVVFENPFLMSATPVTVEQFRQFIEATGYVTVAEKNNFTSIRNPQNGLWEQMKGINWRHDNRGQVSKDNYPVVHVSWDDAKAYTQWLTDITGQVYRLPSEAEMEYANRAGSTTKYWWGNGTPQRQVANLKGEYDIPENDLTWYPTPNERQHAYDHGYTPFFFENYGDKYWGISPVASYEPNPFGIYDTAGNVWEWTEDCWHGSYHGAPVDGSAWIGNGACEYRIVRGGSYYCFPRHVRSANRWKLLRTHTSMYIGFRVVIENQN